MTTANKKPKVGLLALTLEFYERLAPELRGQREEWLRRAVLPALRKSAEIVFNGAVYRREDVDAAITAMEAADVDVLLVMLLTYSPSQISLPALKRTRLPIVVWNTQELFGVGANFDVAAMVGNHGVHGTQDLCNVLLRGGVAFEYVTSHLRDAEATERLTDFFAAAAAVHELRGLRIGLLGYPFPGMGDFALDTTHMAATLGCGWTALSVQEYINRSAQADAASVKQLVDEYRDSYKVADDITDDDLRSAAGAELALRGMIADHRLGALTYQFMAFGEDSRTGTLPFVAASRMMADGIGFGGEGDLIAAAGTAFLHRLNPPASFTEMFTIDFEGGSVFMSHMGEANVAMARRNGKTPLVARPAKIVPTKDRQLALVVNFEPGPATLCALTQGPGSRWRLIVSRVTILDFGPLKNLEAPHTKIEPSRDVRDFLSAYAEAGGPHHCALCFGDARSRLKSAARLLNADYVEV